MKNTTILIVEDEKEIADLIKLYLTNEGYKTYSYANGHEALNALEIHPFGFAILDIMLPDMNGFIICQEIRKKYTFPGSRAHCQSKGTAAACR